MSENRLVYRWWVSYILIYLIVYFLPIFLLWGEKKIKIDREYSCVWFEECDYLMKHGIRYTFVKEIDGVTVWKFKKTEELFHILAVFYGNVYSN